MSNKQKGKINSPGAEDSGRILRGRNKSYQQAQASGAMGSITEGEESSDFINPDSFAKSTVDDKLTIIMASLNKLHNKFDTVHDVLYEKDTGLVPRMDAAEEKIEKLEETEEYSEFNITVVKGILHRQQQQIQTLTDQVGDLQTRLMSENIMITGLLNKHIVILDELAVAEDNKIKNMGEGASLTELEIQNVIRRVQEDNHIVQTGDQVAIEFVRRFLEVSISDEELLECFWMGDPNQGKSVPLVVKCVPRVKDLILQSAKKLKGLENPFGKPYFINVQAPEHVVSTRKFNSFMIGKIKRDNKNRPVHLRTKI